MSASRRRELSHAAGTPVLHGFAAMDLAWCHSGRLCGVRCCVARGCSSSCCAVLAGFGTAFPCFGVWHGIAAGAAGHGFAGLQGLRGLAAGCSGAQQEARTKYVLTSGKDHNRPSH